MLSIKILYKNALIFGVLVLANSSLRAATTRRVSWGERVDDAGEYVAEKYDNAKEYVADKYDEVKEFVKEKVGSVSEIKSPKHFDRIVRANKVVVAKFYSPSCVHCKHYKEPFEQAAAQSDKAAFVAVNIDKQKTLASRYHVGGIPATVIIKDGKEVNRSGGAQSKAQVLKQIRPHVG